MINWGLIIVVIYHILVVVVHDKEEICWSIRHLNLEYNSIHCIRYDANREFSLLHLNVHEYSNYSGLALLLLMH